MVQIISDNKKASKNEPIFRYYSNGEDEIRKQIASIDEEINNALSSVNSNLYSSDISSLESQIEKLVMNMQNENNIQQINENKKSVSEYIYKKTQITGSLSEDKYVKELTAKRKNLEEELEKDSEIIYASTAGIVSYRVDELENILITNDFSYLSSDFLSGLELKSGSIVPINSECGKIVDNFSCYIAVSMDGENAMNAKIGDKATIRILATTEVKAEIAYIKNDGENRIIVFKIENGVESLISYRKLSIDVIWWKYSGLKIINSALITENGKTYVEVSEAGYNEKVLVKVLRQTDSYSIISNYEETELKNMGYSEKEIDEMSKINLYDEVILQNK